MTSAPAERQGQDVHLTSYPPAVEAVTEFSSVSPETVLTIFRRMNSDRRGASYAERPHTRPPGLSGTTDGTSRDLDTVHVQQHPAGDPLAGPGLDLCTVKASDLLQELDSMKGAPSSKRTAEPSQRENTSSTKVSGDEKRDDVSSANHARINEGAETDVATPPSVIQSSTSDTQTRRSTENSVSSRPSEEASVDKRTKIRHKEAQDLKEKLLTLRRENRRLKARQTCRWCHERPAALTLLPCGHYCYCERCGSSFQTCPICGKTVLADVKTILP